MPGVTEEGNKGSHTTDSPVSIGTLWRKFHFSGRVIMCSVLFGLGLILIGGLIFAINVDDDSSKPISEDITDSLPTKPPSNYVGPVVMGVGGFIVVVGVIMCLFETQVCRKKTDDASPLMSGRTDDIEDKVSDPSAVPSSSHSHKNHRHKSRKAAASPRKSKSRHGKSSSHDQNQKKISSSKSPPVSINQSKSFTSSEDKFLTPPNTLDEQAALVHSNAEIQTSASLMKSFTSSDTSWNKSTEFLTPSTSFKDTSISIENSVELYEKQGQVNFKASEAYVNPEYMTPLTVEEDRIQRLFIRVKNEQQEMTKRKMEEKLSAASLNTGSENNDSNSSKIVVKAAKETSEVPLRAEDISNPIDESPSTSFSSTPTLNETKDQNAELNVEVLEENKKRDEGDFVSSEQKVVPTENPAVTKNNEAVLSDVNSHIHEKENIFVPGEKKHVSPPTPDSQKLPMKDAQHDSSFDIDTEASDSKINENEDQVDLESSVSSNETVISRNNSIEKPNNEVEDTKTLTKENATKESISESPDDVKSTINHNSDSHQNISSDALNGKEAGASDLKHRENSKIEDKNIEEVSGEKSS